MVALARVPGSTRPPPAKRPRARSDRFLEMLPAIRKIARFAFRRLPRDQRSEAEQEVVASCYVAYCRLVGRGRESIIFPSPLAWYGVAQYRAGRRIGSSQNVRDIGSLLCQQRHRVTVEPLVRRTQSGDWEDVLVEDRHSTPADIAITRLDFTTWLRQLDRRRRTAAKLLASGTTTGEAAQELGVSPARISQLRNELRESWDEFQHELNELVAA